MRPQRRPLQPPQPPLAVTALPLEEAAKPSAPALTSSRCSPRSRSLNSKRSAFKTLSYNFGHKSSSDDAIQNQKPMV